MVSKAAIQLMKLVHETLKVSGSKCVKFDSPLQNVVEHNDLLRLFLRRYLLVN